LILLVFVAPALPQVFEEEPLDTTSTTTEEGEPAYDDYTDDYSDPYDDDYSYDYSSGGLITNIFYESDIRDALRDVSVQAGVPIIADPSVQGWVTLEVEGLTLEETLNRLLLPGGYTYRKMEGYYLVGAAYPENPSFPLLSEVRRIKPSYLRADQIPLLLSPFYEPFLRVDPEANVVVVSGSHEVVQRVIKDLEAIDIPPKQVMIEALVTEVTTSSMKQLGIDWAVIGRGDNYIGALSQMVTGPMDSSLSFNYGRINAGTLGGADLSIWMAVNALAESGELKVHANPKLVTLDGQPATLFLGREEFLQILTGPETYLYTRLEVIKVGVSLAIKPFVADNGDITLEVLPEVSDVVGTGFTEDFPVVLKRNVTTEIRVKDGETITIGGLVSRTETERETKVPFLGDIPILGYLFKSTKPEVDESEIVIFITPHVLED
jgi:type IV pilus assembly protein PilQ